MVVVLEVFILCCVFWFGELLVNECSVLVVVGWYVCCIYFDLVMVIGLCGCDWLFVVLDFCYLDMFVL